MNQSEKYALDAAVNALRDYLVECKDTDVCKRVYDTLDTLNRERRKDMPHTVWETFEIESSSLHELSTRVGELTHDYTLKITIGADGSLHISGVQLPS